MLITKRQPNSTAKTNAKMNGYVTSDFTMIQ